MDKHKRISCIEFTFWDYNFLHLTGLKTTKALHEQSAGCRSSDRISAVRFYEKCLNHRLMATDFEFSDSGTTPLKLDVLPLLICKNLSANMIGNFNSPHPKLYTEKVAGNAKAYMGFIKDAVTQVYVPNTVVKEDLRESVSDYVRVIATYRKMTNDSKILRDCICSKKDSVE